MYIKIRELKIYACRAETKISRSINSTKTGVISDVNITDDNEKNENMYNII